MKWSPDEESRLSEYLIQSVVDKALGKSEEECTNNYPRDVYFLGNFRPQDPDLADPRVAVRELMNKLAPSATGWEIALRPTNQTLAVTLKLSWSLYYRVFASFEQQKQYQIRNADEKTGQGSATMRRPVSDETDELQVTDSNPRVSDKLAKMKDSLAPRFKVIRCQAEAEIRGDVTSEPNVNIEPLQGAIDSELTRAKDVWRQDPERIRVRADLNEYVQVPLQALASANDYRAYTDSLTVEVPPQWQMSLEASLASSSPADEFVLSIDVVNTSPPTRIKNKENPNLEHFVFNPVFNVYFTQGTPLPFSIDLAPRGFRYDRHLWGRGFNCAICRDSPTDPRFVTSHVPIYKQKRYSTRSVPAAEFADLADNPVPVLETILEAMKCYLGEWTNQREKYVASDPNWAQKHAAEFDEDFAHYKDEIARFEAGLNLIRNDADVNYAFKLTNETFHRGTKSGWRLFQIVFLVTQVLGIAELGKNQLSDERTKVDIIYFPTGGGKTEAYLGVIVFHCFYDRLRGKSAGVTAWTRFPLRLLTLQQTQRAADALGIAELVRKEQADKRLTADGVDPFAIGYFVGEGGSPNELADPTKVPYATTDLEISWAKATDATARQQWKRIVRCPACRTDTVVVDFDPSKVRLMHKCTNSSCKFPTGIIPVFVVDNEIYRELPAVVVGTIDKLAGLGNQRKMALIFGKTDGRCSVHGYFKQKCCQKDCTDRKLLKKGSPPGISGPTLFVQDELHLLKEGLGTFDSHYETFTQALLNEFGFSQPLKVIASSATIEAFDRQVSHLYGRLPGEARVFPGQGPTLDGSFYAETLDHHQRLYVGLIPHNKVIFNAILELIEYYHRALYLLRKCSATTKPFMGTLVPGSPPWNELIDLYATSLTYFLAGRDLNSVRTDLIGHVFPIFESEDIPVPRIHELTGGTTTDEVQRSLETLERTSSDQFQSDAVLATSMVSHGVDVDRLNAMIFYGMPRQNAEYIQASSRVGRTHVGIIFTCLHPARERDQSHYGYFVKFHEFLGQLIEPVPINRWAKFSLNRTVPGLFMAALLQKFANESAKDKPDSFYLLDFIRKKISAGELTPSMFIPLLERAYLLSGNLSAGAATFKSELHRLVTQFFDQIICAGPQYKFVSEVLIPKPMRSLRDVDEPIDIELDSEGTEWARKATAQRGQSHGA
jgi:hypothetical protein